MQAKCVFSKEEVYKLTAVTQTAVEEELLKPLNRSIEPLKR